MLISALCDYYDDLARDGKVAPDGYSEQPVDYLVALTPDGKIGIYNSAYTSWEAGTYVALCGW